jgi:SAM-dependent methyltransferase
MYFDKLDLWKRLSDACILHFAPESDLSRRIKTENPRLYVMGDLYPDEATVEKIDVTGISFPDCHFDVLICNHVLNCAKDDRKALSECFRVLKPGGWLVLQTPYSTVLRHSFSDPALNSRRLRFYYYGDPNFCRIYGQDLFERIRGAGFELELVSHGQHLSEMNATYYGVSEAEEFLLIRRP